SDPCVLSVLSLSFLHCYRPCRFLHSFPTRRSSDLSGTFESKSRHVSKRGSPHLRRTLFIISSVILQLSHEDNPVFCFMDKKRSRSEEHTSELQSRFDLVCRLLLEKKKK